MAEIYYELLSLGNPWVIKDCADNFAEYLMERPDNIGGDMCTCFAAISQYQPEYLEWFECVDVTYHTMPMFKSSTPGCFDAFTQAQTCVNIVAWVASRALLSGNTVDASQCWSALRYGSQTGEMDQVLKTMICKCYSAAAALDLGRVSFDLDPPEIDWLTCGSWLESEEDFDPAIQCDTDVANKIKTSTFGKSWWWEPEDIGIVVLLPILCILLTFSAAYKIGEVTAGRNKALAGNIIKRDSFEQYHTLYRTTV